MSSQSAEQLTSKLDQAAEELSSNFEQSHANNSRDQYRDRVARWKKRWGSWIDENISADDATKFKNLDRHIVLRSGMPSWSRETEDYKRFLDFFCALKDDIENYPDAYLSSPGEKFLSQTSQTPEQASRNVFIVHGHDGANLAQLSALLKDEFGLEPIVLKKKAGGSRHILLKFEQEAKKAAFALVLLTPDDIVKSEKEEFAQARPNAIFELGWFFRHLGHERVRIIMRKGTKIHSDLAGIERLEFHEEVDEIVIKLRRELEAGGYDPGKKEFVS